MLQVKANGRFSNCRWFVDYIRHTSIMQLSRSLEGQQLFLESTRNKESFWRRWFRNKKNDDRA